MRVQEMVHRLLYCESHEADLYHTQFIEASERAKIDFNEISSEVVERIAKEFERRVYRKASDQEMFSRDLIFYQILSFCLDEKSEEEILVAIEQPEDCVCQNIVVLVQIGLLAKKSDKHTTTPKGRKLHRQLSAL